MPEVAGGARTFRFDQMATLINERVDNPAESGVERYVGLEHLDANSLRIRRWGEITDVESTKLRFEPGDIIFGKRRVYQRKLAVANFAGICSAHAMVLRAKADVVLPQFLPFFMRSDHFMERALQISVGSLSPTINWTTLAAEQFALPPIQEQRRLIVGLSAAEIASESLLRLSLRAEAVFRAALHCYLSAGGPGGDSVQTEDLIHPIDWPVVALADVASVDRGKFSHRPRNLPEFYGGPYPFAQTGDVAAGRGYRFSASQTLSEEGRGYSRPFPPDTVLVTIAAVIGATAITTDETWCTDSVVGIVPRDREDALFIDYALRYRRHYLEYEVATQTAQKNINLGVLRPLLIPWPSAEVRRAIEEILNPLESAFDAAESRRKHVMQLMSRLLSESGGD